MLETIKTEGKSLNSYIDIVGKDEIERVPEKSTKMEN